MKLQYFLPTLYLLMFNSINIFAQTNNVFTEYQKQGSSCDNPLSKGDSDSYQLSSSSQINNITDAEILFRKTQSNPNQSLLIIDTRPASEFSQFSIKDSVNLSASSIQTKQYWKDRDIYLISGEKFDLPLLAIADRLNQLGFKNVKVISGGINTWVNKRMPVIGKVPNANRLIQLSAEDVWTSRKDATTLYVLDSDYTQFSKFFSNTLVINNLSAKSPENAIQDYLNTHRKMRLSKVYFLTSSTGIDNSVVSGFNQKPLYASFLFNAKPEFLSEYISNFDKLLIAKENGPKKPKCG
jgi:rhodanese-related sulfurtransferase